jgi:hypothetical protein
MIDAPATRELHMGRYDDDDDYDDRPASRRRHDDEDDEREYDFQKRDVPHSGLGIASVALAVVAGVGLLIIFGIAGVMAADAGGDLDEESPEVMVLGVLALGACALTLLGLGLGIGALLQKDRRKGFAIAGVVANGLVLLGTSGLMCVGAMMG